MGGETCGGENEVDGPSEVQDEQGSVLHRERVGDGAVAGPSGQRVYISFFFQAEDGIRDYKVTGVQTCALPIFAENRKARFDYFIEERYEAGIALQGWEVKAMRAGRAQLKEAYVYLRDGEAFLIGAHLSPLASTSTHVSADPVRTRKLLLHHSELQGLI